MSQVVVTCNVCIKEFVNEKHLKKHYKSEWHRYNLKCKMEGDVPRMTEARFLAEEKRKLNKSQLVNKEDFDEEIDELEEVTCNLCNKLFVNEKNLKKHYKSKWHRYNLKCKMEGVPGMTEALFLARKSKLAEEKRKLKKNQSVNKEKFNEEIDEPERVNQNDDLVGEITSSLNHMEIDGVHCDNDDDDDDDEVEVDPTCCFMCDKKHKTIESCMGHMHKYHGLFIPYVEYLKDPGGLLTYLGIKVKREFTCLYCNINCHAFESLEAVRMHMVAKYHCRVHYGDGGEEEEAELDEFYDYSNSYVDINGKQLVTTDGSLDRIEIGTGGSALIISRATDDGISTKVIGARQYLRYYRQKPRPSPNSIAITAVHAARHRSMCLSTLQSKDKENMVRTKASKQVKRPGVESTRCKMAIKSNVMRNFPKNVLH